MLYRRHYAAREVPPSERFQEGTASAEGATYDDTTRGLTVQQVTGDGATTHGSGQGEPEHDPATEQVTEDLTGEQLRERAKGLGVPTSGSKAELVERINAELERRRPLSDDELAAAIEADLVTDLDAEHDPAEVRDRLAELAK